MMNLTNQQNNIYNAAIYCRLSKDDGMDVLSQSIISQKESLVKYAQDNGFLLGDVYIDDGYSGTNFNRPGFKRLISDIEKKKINCVITKDLSRLGRNYLQTGYYTEEFFPEHNVRYIAVNDSYDSLDEENDFTPFKNIINEWYAKDISKKIKSSFKHRQKEGTLVINSPYGYINDKKVGRKLDEIAAPVVEFIFSAFVNDNKSVTEICKFLTNKKILVPKAYKAYKDKNSEMPCGYTLEMCYTWTRQMIYSILREYQYTGALICNKSHNLSFKNHKKVMHNSDEWVIHEKKFDPIISNELFYKAKQKIVNSGKAQLPLTINKYNGILFCKECGRKATFLRNSKFPDGMYLCRVKGCKHKRISLNELDQIIKKEILTFRNEIIKNEDKIRKFLSSKHGDLSSNIKETQLNKFENEKKKIGIIISEAFEAKCNGEIIDSIYRQILKENEILLSDLESKINILKNENEKKYVDLSSINIFIDNIKGFNEYTRLTRNVIQTLIKRIEYGLDVNSNIISFDISYYGLDWLVSEYDIIE